MKLLPVASAVGLALSAVSAYGQAPNVTYQFQIVTETLHTSSGVELVCGPPNGPPCANSIGRLTLTNKAFTGHTAQLSTETNPITNDGLVSFVQSVAPGSIVLNWPPSPVPGYPNQYVGTDAVFDLTVYGGELSGNISIYNSSVPFQAHISCALSMQGIDGNWSGTWGCSPDPGQTFYAFTAFPVMQIVRH
jgi:hypothetical protein